jgi:hypothetical protein
VFVSSTAFPEMDGTLDGFVRSWVADASARGFTVEELQSALSRVPRPDRPQSFVVADPDLEFARILATEIGAAIGQPVGFVTVAQISPEIGAANCVLANSAHISKFPASVQPLAIRLKSMQDVLAGQQRPSAPVLVAVISRSEEIHSWSARLLSALGFPAESVIQRNPCDARWSDGLGICGIVAADVVAAAELPADLKPIVFRFVSDDFLQELSALVTPLKAS